MIHSVLVGGVAMEEVWAALTVVGELLLTERTTTLTPDSWLLPTRMTSRSWSWRTMWYSNTVQDTLCYFFCRCQSTLRCPVLALEQSSCMLGTLFQTEELEVEVLREPEKSIIWVPLNRYSTIPLWMRCAALWTFSWVGLPRTVVWGLGRVPQTMRQRTLAPHQTDVCRCITWVYFTHSKTYLMEMNGIVCSTYLKSMFRNSSGSVGDSFIA